MQIHQRLLGAFAALAMTLSHAACVGGNALESLTISPDSATIEAGSSRSFTATAVFCDETTEDYTDLVEWSSSDPSVADFDLVSGAAVLVAKTVGTVEIQALDPVSGVAAKASVTVTAASLESVEMEMDPAAVAAGLSVNARAFAVYADGSRSEVTQDASWSSGDEAVATVSNDAGTRGRVSGVAQGQAEISAVFEGKTAKMNVTVTEAELVSVEIEAASNVPHGLTTDARLIAVHTDGTRVNVSELAQWSTSDATVASVSNVVVSKGRVTGVAMGGPVTITAEYEGMSAQASIAVGPAILVAVHTSGPSKTMAPGQTMQLTATGTFSDGRVEDVTTLLSWTSSNYLVATVGRTEGKHGLVTSHSEGFVSIEGLDPVSGLNCTYQITVEGTL